MDDTRITRERIDVLLRFLPALGNPGPDTEAQWHEDEQDADDDVAMSSVTYPAVVEQFFALASQEWWCDFGYDPAVIGPIIDDDGAIASSSLAEIRSLLTFCVRGERFCEGHWNGMIRGGRIGAILRRLSALRDEAPAD